MKTPSAASKASSLTWEAARQGLAAVRAKGGEDARRVAKVNLDKALSRLGAVKTALAQDTVRAPISGVVQMPATPDEMLVRGRAVEKGETLLTIADVDRLSVLAPVDEVEVTAIRPGQPVTVRGDAFSGLVLRGTVSHVSEQPRALKPKGGTPQFDVTVRLDGLGEAQRKRLRIGMSAHLHIVTYSNPSALMVLIEAVGESGGASVVRVLDKATGEVRTRVVEVGLTTLDKIEVTGGLKAGETVVLDGV